MLLQKLQVYLYQLLIQQLSYHLQITEQKLQLEHTALLEAWKGLRAAKTQESFFEEITTSVLPALRKYVAHLNEVRTTIKELSSVHYRLIEGYRALEEKLSDFVTDGRSMEKDEAKKALAKMFQETRDIEAVYWQDVQNIYNRHGFQLSQTAQEKE